MRRSPTRPSVGGRGLAVRLMVVIELVVLLTGLAPAGAQDVPDIDPLLAVVDDPTYLARSIDERISRAVAECLAASQVEYSMAPDARFDLQEIDVGGADLVVEGRFTDFVPRVIDPTDVVSDFIESTTTTAAPEPRFAPPTLAAELVDPDILDTDAVIVAEASQLVAVSPEISDPALRIDPTTDGYGVSVDAFAVTLQDPNLVAVQSLSDEELIDYERAFYGTALRDIERTTEPGGCALVVEDILVNEVVPEMEGLQGHLVDLTARVEESPEYAVALDQWSDCLAATDVGADLEIATPDDAVSIVADQYGELGALAANELEALRNFETRLATADYDCRAQTTDLATTAVLLREGGTYAAEVLRVGSEITLGGG